MKLSRLVATAAVSALAAGATQVVLSHSDGGVQDVSFKVEVSAAE